MPSESSIFDDHPTSTPLSFNDPVIKPVVDDSDVDDSFLPNSGAFNWPAIETERAAAEVSNNSVFSNVGTDILKAFREHSVLMDEMFQGCRDRLKADFEESQADFKRMVTDYRAANDEYEKQSAAWIKSMMDQITACAHAQMARAVGDVDAPLSFVQPSTPGSDHNLVAYRSTPPHSFPGNLFWLDDGVESGLSSSSSQAQWQPSRSSWDSVPAVPEYRMAPKAIEKENRRKRKSDSTKAPVSEFQSRIMAAKTATRQSVSQCKKTAKIRGYEQELREAYRTAYRTEKDEASLRGETLGPRFKKAAKRRAWLEGYALLESEMTQKSWQDERAAEQSAETARQASYGACDPRSRRQCHGLSATRNVHSQFSSPPHTLDW
jgi:hypothetical protein